METELFLVQRFPDGPRNEWALKRGQQVVGRSSRCDITVVDETVSRKHAEIFVDEDGVRVVDLGSRNGTFLNGARIQEEVVPLGSIVQFGRIECVLANAQMLQEFADSEFSTRQYQPKNGVKRLEQLSEAQTRVLPFLLKGLAEKEVATRLDLSPHTIHHHVSAIYEILEVSSRAELMALCLHQ